MCPSGAARGIGFTTWRWQRDGTWVRIVTQLQAQADANRLIIWDVNVDSTSVGPTSTPPGRLKRHRAVAARYGKLAVRYEASVLVAVLNEWL